MTDNRDNAIQAFDNETFDGVHKGDLLAVDMSDNADVVKYTYGIAVVKVCSVGCALIVLMWWKHCLYVRFRSSRHLERLRLRSSG